MIEISNSIVTVTDANGTQHSVPTINEHTQIEQNRTDIASLSSEIDTLNGKTTASSFTITTSYGNVFVSKCGNHISIYGDLLGLPTNSLNTLLVTDDRLKSIKNYGMGAAYSKTSPYTPIGSAWVSTSGALTVYKPQSTSAVYISINYICQ